MRDVHARHAGACPQATRCYLEPPDADPPAVLAPHLAGVPWVCAMGAGCVMRCEMWIDCSVACYEMWIDCSVDCYEMWIDCSVDC